MQPNLRAKVAIPRIITPKLLPVGFAEFATFFLELFHHQIVRKHPMGFILGALFLRVAIPADAW